MAAAVTSRIFMRGIATGKVILRLEGHALRTSGLKRRFHVSTVSQGLKLCAY